MQNHKMKLLPLFFLMVLLSGCASFENNEIKYVDSFPDVSQYTNKPSVYVNLKYFRGLPDNNPIEVPAGIEMLKPIAQKALSSSLLFSDYSFDSPRGKDYIIDLKVYNHGSEVAAFLSGFLTGFSFFILPGAATDNYTLTMKALDPEGNELSTYQNKDSMITWIGIWFIPVIGNTPQKASAKTLENQICDALKMLIEDKALKYSYLNKSISPLICQR